ncbi:hypothetical protein GCM10023116_33440 [Kistimonas scapharcae]|uniref:SnoaL-like domain-containing protein n=1 Tax=Kistimonas scapharcae TaxID=1036133 RepID=A0ABP8V5I9_9GAMM
MTEPFTSLKKQFTHLVAGIIVCLSIPAISQANTAPHAHHNHQHPVITCNQLMELLFLDDLWPQIVAERDLEAMGDFYDEYSILAEFPYDESRNLVGVETIAAMFENGPFSLPGELSLTTLPVARVAFQDTGLIIKQWTMVNSAGSFQGIAVKLLNYTDHWNRLIDLEAGGLVNLADFASTDQPMDNTAFDHLADHLLSAVEGAKVINLDNQDETVTYPDSELTVTTLAAIPNQNHGLLIAKVSDTDHEYLTFNALEKTENGWQVVIQARTTLTTHK